jgi:hypothetical protein
VSEGDGRGCSDGEHSRGPAHRLREDRGGGARGRQAASQAPGLQDPLHGPHKTPRAAALKLRAGTPQAVGGGQGRNGRGDRQGGGGTGRASGSWLLRRKGSGTT